MMNVPYASDDELRQSLATLAHRRDPGQFSQIRFIRFTAKASLRFESCYRLRSFRRMPTNIRSRTVEADCSAFDDLVNLSQRPASATDKFSKAVRIMFFDALISYVYVSTWAPRIPLPTPLHIRRARVLLVQLFPLHAGDIARGSAAAD